MTEVRGSPVQSSGMPPDLRPRMIDVPLTLLGAVLVWLLPRTAGRWWTRAPHWLPVIVAALNLTVVALAFARLLRTPWVAALLAESSAPRPALYLAAFLAACLFFYLLLLGFSILPFAVRRGSNRACAWHVARTVLFGTTLIYLWAAVIAALYLSQVRIERFLRLDPADIPQFWLLVTAGAPVLLHAATVLLLARAAGVEFRRPRDFPAPPTPRCDDCGYDLHMTAPDRRCPECGKPVAESLGPASRVPTPWQRRPSLLNLPAIARQLLQLYTRPLRFFRRMPVFDGLPPARRWLRLMLALVACEAFWIVGGLHASNPNLFLGMNAWQFYAVGAIIGLAWASLGLMMVGIETAGVAIASWWRGAPLELAAAAQITSYASSLMFFWVILGGAEIIAGAAYDAHLLPRLALGRYDEFLLGGSLAVAHIGGLLWFELVVYRGLRAIQFANK